MHTTQYPSSFKRPSLWSTASDPDGRTHSRSRFGKFIAFATRKFSQESKKNRSLSASNKPDNGIGTIQEVVDMLPSVSSIRDELRLSTEKTAYHNDGVPTLGRHSPYGAGSTRPSCEERTGSQFSIQDVSEPGSKLRISSSEPEFNINFLKKTRKRSSASLRHRFGFIPSTQDPLSEILRTTSPLPLPTSMSQSAVSAIGHALMDRANWSVGSKSTCSPTKQLVSQQVTSSPRSLMSESSTTDTIIAIINLYANTSDRKVMPQRKGFSSYMRQSVAQFGGSSQSPFRPSTEAPIFKPETVSHETPDPLSMYSSENRTLLNPTRSTSLDRLARLKAWNRNATPKTSTATFLRTPALNLVPATPSMKEDNCKEEDSNCEDDILIYDCYDQTNDDMIATAL